MEGSLKWPGFTEIRNILHHRECQIQLCWSDQVANSQLFFFQLSLSYQNPDILYRVDNMKLLIGPHAKNSWIPEDWKNTPSKKVQIVRLLQIPMPGIKLQLWDCSTWRLIQKRWSIWRRPAQVWSKVDRKIAWDWEGHDCAKHTSGCWRGKSGEL